MELGVDEETATEDACRIEHVISEKSFAAVQAHLEQVTKMREDAHGQWAYANLADFAIERQRDKWIPAIWHGISNAVEPGYGLHRILCDLRF